MLQVLRRPGVGVGGGGSQYKLPGPDYDAYVFVCLAIIRSADKSLSRPAWKKKLKGRHFSSDAVIAAPETRLVGEFSEFFFKWLAKLVWLL
jgi:hypothetical protein